MIYKKRLCETFWVTWKQLFKIILKIMCYWIFKDVLGKKNLEKIYVEYEVYLVLFIECSYDINISYD